MRCAARDFESHLSPGLPPLHRPPASLPARVRQFYEFQWIHRGVSNDFLRDLPEALRSDIAVSQYASLLQKVPIFSSVRST